MATINLDLYVLWQEQRLITSLTNDAAPVLPTITAGDTWAIRVFYVDNTTPRQYHRFPASTTQVRFYAEGNSHIYASGTSGSEIVAARPPATITRIQAGIASGGAAFVVQEIQRLVMPSGIVGGTFKVTFTRPSSINASSIPSGRTALEKVFDGLPYNLHGRDLEALIHASDGYYSYFPDGSLEAGPATLAALGYPSNNRLFLTFNGSETLYLSTHINFNYGGEVNSGGVTYNGWPTGLPLLQVDTSNLLFPDLQDGWNVSVPLTASDFSDLFVSANGPGYLEIYLNGNIAGRIQVSGSPGPVAITSGQPPSPAPAGSPYNFVFTANGFPAPTFAVTSGVLPNGLSLSSNGTLSGTPVFPGTYNLTVTASNSAGSASQSFTIIISSSTPGDNPGGGAAGPLATKRDGDYAIVEPCDGAWAEVFDEWPGLILWHIPMCLDIGAAVAPAIGQFEAPFGYFYKDTPWRYIGDNIVMFERLRHNVPGDANRPVSTSKNYQAAQPTFSGGALVDIAIVSFSRPIKANCNYHYALDDPGGLPVIPFIQVIPWLHGQAITDLSTGFPTRNDLPIKPFVDNNYGVTAIEGGSITHIFGRLFCRKVITG